MVNHYLFYSLFALKFHQLKKSLELSGGSTGLKISGIPISMGYQISILDTRYHRLSIQKNRNIGEVCALRRNVRQNNIFLLFVARKRNGPEHKVKNITNDYAQFPVAIAT